MLTSGKNLDRQFNRIGRGGFALSHSARLMRLLYWMYVMFFM